MRHLGTEHPIAVTCVAINAADATGDSVCPVCFPGQIAARRAAHRYGVERHSSMEALVADLASEDN
jgi:hypothetical protein